MLRAAQQIRRIMLVVRDSHGEACRDAVGGTLAGEAHGLDEPVADQPRPRRRRVRENGGKLFVRAADDPVVRSRAVNLQRALQYIDAISRRLFVERDKDDGKGSAFGGAPVPGVLQSLFQLVLGLERGEGSEIRYHRTNIGRTAASCKCRRKINYALLFGSDAPPR